MSIPSSATEATTRSQVIDIQLAQAGWRKSRRSLIEEFVLMAKEPERRLVLRWLHSQGLQLLAFTAGA